MQTNYGFFWLAKIFGCEPNGSAKKIPSASLVYTICRNTLIIKLYNYVGSLRDLSE